MSGLYQRTGWGGNTAVNVSLDLHRPSLVTVCSRSTSLATHSSNFLDTCNFFEGRGAGGGIMAWGCIPACWVRMDRHLCAPTITHILTPTIAVGSQCKELCSIVHIYVPRENYPSFVCCASRWKCCRIRSYPGYLDGGCPITTVNDANVKCVRMGSLVNIVLRRYLS